MNVTAAEVKAFAKNAGADLVGIAPMSRWEGAPMQMDPRYIFPQAKSMIVLAFRIARGMLRGIEEGTHFNVYPSMGYAALNQIYGPMVLWNLTRWLEDLGHETMPFPNQNGGEAINPVTGKFRQNWSLPVEPGKPYPDVLVSHRIAAYLAGLGEIGFSKVFLTPEFGPRQRFALCFTDAELEPDPIFEGKICDRCKLCVKHCAGQALSRDETVNVTLAGHEVEWSRIDPLKCEAGLKGGPGRELDPFIQDYPHFYGYGRAIEGACGCIRACMVHLEEKGILKNKFDRPFREKGRKQWKIDHAARDAEPLTVEVEETYAQAGMLEDAAAYIKYSVEDNHGGKSKNDRAEDAPALQKAGGWLSKVQKLPDLAD